MGTDADPRAAEIHRLASLEPPAWCIAAAIAERLAIRAFRLTGAMAIVGIAVWLWNIAADILSKPFAALSPLALVGGILAGVAGLLFLVLAISVAFGPKGHSRIEAAWRVSQGNTVQSKRRLLGYDN